MRIGADTDSSEAAAVLAEALSAKSERTREGGDQQSPVLVESGVQCAAHRALWHSDREVRAAAESILTKLKPANDR